MIARLTVQRGTLTEFPIAEKVRGGWQNGVTFYSEDEVVSVQELDVKPAQSSTVTEAQAALAEKASRHELRDITFVGILEKLREADDRDGPKHYVGNRYEAAGDLYEAARQHFARLTPAQQEQVTTYQPCVTDSNGECTRWSHDHTTPEGEKPNA